MQYETALLDYRRYLFFRPFTAAFRDGESASRQVLIVSGTGSACYARNPNGKEIKVGGWGHLLGDKGSGYAIGLRALKAAPRESADAWTQWHTAEAAALEALWLRRAADREPDSSKL